MCELNCRSAGSHVFILAQAWTMRAQQMRQNGTGPTVTGQQLGFNSCPRFYSPLYQYLLSNQNDFMCSPPDHTQRQTFKSWECSLCMFELVVVFYMEKKLYLILLTTTWHQPGFRFQRSPSTCENTFDNTIIDQNHISNTWAVTQSSLIWENQHAASLWCATSAAFPTLETFRL